MYKLDRLDVIKELVTVSRKRSIKTWCDRERLTFDNELDIEVYNSYKYYQNQEDSYLGVVIEYYITHMRSGSTEEINFDKYYQSILKWHYFDRIFINDYCFYEQSVSELPNGDIQFTYLADSISDYRSFPALIEHKWIEHIENNNPYIPNYQGFMPSKQIRDRFQYFLNVYRKAYFTMYPILTEYYKNSIYGAIIDIYFIHIIKSYSKENNVFESIVQKLGAKAIDIDICDIYRQVFIEENKIIKDNNFIFSSIDYLEPKYHKPLDEVSYDLLTLFSKITQRSIEDINEALKFLTVELDKNDKKHNIQISPFIKYKEKIYYIRSKVAKSDALLIYLESIHKNCTKSIENIAMQLYPNIIVRQPKPKCDSFNYKLLAVANKTIKLDEQIEESKEIELDCIIIDPIYKLILLIEYKHSIHNRKMNRNILLYIKNQLSYAIKQLNRAMVYFKSSESLKFSKEYDLDDLRNYIIKPLIVSNIYEGESIGAKGIQKISFPEFSWLASGKSLPEVIDVLNLIYEDTYCKLYEENTVRTHSILGENIYSRDEQIIKLNSIPKQGI